METFRQHLGDHLATILVVGAMSGAITFVEIARPSLTQLASILPLPAKQVTPTVPTPAPTPQPAAVVAPQPVPVAAPVVAPPPPAPVVRKAVTNSFVHMRAGKGTHFPIIMDLQAGTEVELRDDSNSQWQGIIYQGKSGYLFKAYVAY